MFSIQLNWPSFSVSLPMVESWVKANAGTGYVGNSADSISSQLTLWYSSDPSAYADAVNAYWSGLTDASPEATGYVTQEQIKTATANLRASCVGKTWDSMSAAQQKLILNLPLTNTDLGL